MPELLARLEKGDSTLWPEGNVSATRLGWLKLAQTMEAEAVELRQWADSIDAGHIALLGMGGSSLGPAVLSSVAKAKNTGNGRILTVLDTTDPTTIDNLQTSDTCFIVSSKSGTTLEPNAMLAHAWSKVSKGSQFVAITDRSTPLQTLANEREFRRVFVNPADIGGRYSVLSYFGLVPAALIGYDIGELLTSAIEADLGAAVELGTQMGNNALEGRDKVTVVVPPSHRAFGLWVEQLIAESTGKLGKGCVPVPTMDHEVGTDRFHVEMQDRDPKYLGEEFLRWEVATAIAGHVLNIDPFDEPNVAESKANTARVLEDLPLPKDSASHSEEVLPWLQSSINSGDYVSIQAYLPLADGTKLEEVRRSIRDRFDGIATTAGYGPRFLHSTGQLHKGGPNSILAIQVVPKGGWGELPIPGYDYDFGTLIAAQAIGDHQSLLDHQRRVLRVEVDTLDDLIA